MRFSLTITGADQSTIRAVADILQPETPSSFWSYRADTVTPSYADAIDAGAIDPARMTYFGWQSLTPGMKREIVRSHKKIRNSY